MPPANYDSGSMTHRILDIPKLMLIIKKIGKSFVPFSVSHLFRACKEAFNLSP